LGTSGISMGQRRRHRGRIGGRLGGDRPGLQPAAAALVKPQYERQRGDEGGEAGVDPCPRRQRHPFRVLGRLGWGGGLVGALLAGAAACWRGFWSVWCRRWWLRFLRWLLLLALGR